MSCFWKKTKYNQKWIRVILGNLFKIFPSFAMADIIVM